METRVSDKDAIGICRVTQKGQPLVHPSGMTKDEEKGDGLALTGLPSQIGVWSTSVGLALPTSYIVNKSLVSVSPRQKALLHLE